MAEEEPKEGEEPESIVGSDVAPEPGSTLPEEEQEAGDSTPSEEE